jgi:TolB protein
MNTRSTASLVAALALAASGARSAEGGPGLAPTSSAPASASSVSSASSASSAAEDAVLGTVQVTGAAGVSIPHPKVAIVPLRTEADADTLVQLVARRDFELSGEYDVVTTGLPAGPFLRDDALDGAAHALWKKAGVEIVLRVWSEGAGRDAALAGDVRLTSDRLPEDAPEWPSAYSTKVAFGRAGISLRGASHVLVDRLFGALSGKPGAFASELAYAAAVGKARQLRRLDADGFDLRGDGPAGETALLPQFGEGGELWYLLSEKAGPYRLVHGSRATPLPLSVPGSLLGFSLAPARDRLAVTAMHDGVSTLFLGRADGGAMVAQKTPKYATHPVLGPGGKLALVAGYRVLVDGRAVSPGGFIASAPSFCETERGLLVLFTVGVGRGADLIATDASGGGLFRLTQGQGANTWAACSPDGRRVAYFSTRASGEGPGLYLAPLREPGRARRISGELGEGLAWAPKADLAKLAAEP